MPGPASAEDVKEIHDLNRDVLPIRSVMWRQISLICVPQLMSVGGPLWSIPSSVHTWFCVTQLRQVALL